MTYKWYQIKQIIYQYLYGKNQIKDKNLEPLDIIDELFRANIMADDDDDDDDDDDVF